MTTDRTDQPNDTPPPEQTVGGIDRRRALGAIAGAAGLGGLGVLNASAATQGGVPLPQPGRPPRRDRNRDRDRNPADAGWLLSDEALGWDADAGEYVLPDLPYAYTALEPVIDAQTMEIHHSKHHAGYVRGLNRALRELKRIRSGQGDAGLIKHWSRELAFHGSGHVNHALFWRVMQPPMENNEPRLRKSMQAERLASQIDRDFGSFDGFKTHFAAAAKAVEGSGWGWLVWEPVAGQLLVQQMEKQQNLLMTGVVPLVGIDVWEHAYYLKYQNRRGDYVDQWFKVINWGTVSNMFMRAAM
jgi:Fe-Mn family superoxide dismutase